MKPTHEALDYQTLHTGHAVETPRDCRRCFAAPARAGKDGCCAGCYRRLLRLAATAGRVL